MATHLAPKRPSKARQRIEALAQRARAHTPHGHDASPSAPFDHLGSSWHRIDDIRWPGQSFADVDHVLAGPPGVFVVDTRAWWRTIEQDVDRLSASGPASGDAFWGLSAAAHAVGSLLGMAERRPTPVMCIVGGSEIDEMAGKIMVCSATIVGARLNALPRVYDANEVDLIASRLRTALAPAIGAQRAVPDQRRP